MAAKSQRLRRVHGAAVIAALPLALGACSAGSGVEDPDSSGAGPEASGTTQADDWQQGSDELIAEYRAYLVDLAGSLGLEDPPEVEMVRFVSNDEWAGIQVERLAEQGIQAAVGGQGGVVFDEVPAEQVETVNLAAYTCEAMYPIDPRTQTPLPRVRAVMQYDHLVNTVLPCVRELGFEVSDPPTQQTWLDQYYSGAETWDPYTDVANSGDPADLDQVYEQCPHDAPDLYPPIESG